MIAIVAGRGVAADDRRVLEAGEHVAAVELGGAAHAEGALPHHLGEVACSTTKTTSVEIVSWITHFIVPKKNDEIDSRLVFRFPSFWYNRSSQLYTN